MLKRGAIVLAALLLAILIPVGGFVILLLMEPPAYRLIMTPGAEWETARLLPSGGQAIVRRHADEAAARTAARRLFDSISRSSSHSTPGRYRYRVRDSGQRGMILARERYVVHVTAPNEATLERTLQDLPFLAENTEGRRLSNALDKHPVAFVAAILIYSLLLTLLVFRGAAWVTRQRPPHGRVPASEATLRTRLLALDDEHFVARAWEGGELVFERTADGIVQRLRLRFDADTRVVRAVLTGVVRHRWPLLFSMTWRRSLPLPSWTGRVAAEVNESGWTWQPVVTFVRVLGG